MKLIRLSEEQPNQLELFPIQEVQSTKPEADHSFSEEWFSDDWKEDVEYKAKTEVDMFNILKFNSLNYDVIAFPKMKEKIIYVEEEAKVIDYSVKNNQIFANISDAQEWIDGISELYLDDYLEIPETDPWENLETCTAYHGTTIENAELIMKEGLGQRNETRGLTNRSTGSAVFLSESYDNTQYYYDVVIEVDLCQMAEDGYTPRIEKEAPYAEAQLRSQLAHKIGFENYMADEGQGDGIYGDTIVVFGDIPPKYLNIVN